MSDKINMSAPIVAAGVNGKSGLQTLAICLNKMKPILQATAGKILNPDRMVLLALDSVKKTPALMQCSIESVMLALKHSAEVGLEVGGVRGHGHLMPFKQTCVFVPGYRGFIDLAYRSGRVSSVEAAAVYEGDEFEYEKGLHPKLRHVPTGDNDDDSKITHFYCIARMVEGEPLWDVMSRKQVERIRARSASYKNNSATSPWATDFGEMGKKTVVRRVLKYAPMSIELGKAIALDNAVESGDLSAIEAEFEVSDLPAEEPDKKQGTEAVKRRLGLDKDATAELRAKVAVVFTSHVPEKDRPKFLREALNRKDKEPTVTIEECSHDQLLVLQEALANCPADSDQASLMESEPRG